MPERVSLHDRLYQSWLLQLQTWATDGRLVSAGPDALRLKPVQAAETLNRIADRLAKGDTRNVSPIEVMRGTSTPGVVKEAALIP